MATTSNGSRTNVHEIASGIYRISTPVDMDGIGNGFTFNQYLVVDDEPLLFHTGPRGLFPDVRDAVATVLPVARLRWIGFSHVEADECGSLNQWLAAAPGATPLCGQVAAMVSMNDLADRAPRALADGESLSLGTRRVTWLDTPHLPHAWECGFLHESHTRTLLCGDLFTQGGSGLPALTERDILGPSEAFRGPHGLLLAHPGRAAAPRAPREPGAHHARLHARERLAGRWRRTAARAGRRDRALTRTAAAVPAGRAALCGAGDATVDRGAARAQSTRPGADAFPGIVRGRSSSASLTR